MSDENIYEVGVINDEQAQRIGINPVAYAGPAGATFTPHVENGVLTWTNTLGVENPEPTTVIGPKGDSGEPGRDGTSITHEWEGTVLKVTSAAGTSSTDLKGEKGEKGDTGLQGERGKDGTGLTIKGTYETIEELKAEHLIGSTGDGYLIGGALYVWDAENNIWVNVGQIQGPAGEKGETGADGQDGISPTITTAEHTGGYVLTIADANGQQIIELRHGADGERGADGTSVTHSWNGTELIVTSASGTTTTDLRGEKGEKGDPGEQGPRGEKGADGVMTFEDLTDEQKAGLKGDKGDDGAPGADGKDGANGISATHSWDGTTLTITSASGTSSADLKGEKGDKGDKGDTGETGPAGADGATGADGAAGKDGIDGFSPIVAVTETDDGHTVSIEDTNGVKTFTVKDGIRELADEVTEAGTGAVTSAAIAAYVQAKINEITNYENVSF